MFRLFWVIFRPFKEQIQGNQIYSAFWDPNAYNGWYYHPFLSVRNRSKVIKVYSAFWDPKRPKMYYKLYVGYIPWRAWRWLKRVETCCPKIVFYVMNCCVLTDIFILCIHLCDNLKLCIFVFRSVALLSPCVVGPCHHDMARPQVADRGTASDMEGSCE